MSKIILALFIFSFMSVAIADLHVMKTPTEMEWMEGPPILPAGAQISVIAGDPKVKGPFTIRLKFPAKYQIPAHWHSQDENITVIEGTLNMGMGDKLDITAGHALTVGSYAKMPMKTRHFAFTNEGAIVQIHGMGPFDITYVNSKDDPRKK